MTDQQEPPKLTVQPDPDLAGRQRAREIESPYELLGGGYAVRRILGSRLDPAAARRAAERYADLTPTNAKRLARELTSDDDSAQDAGDRQAARDAADERIDMRRRLAREFLAQARLKGLKRARVREDIDAEENAERERMRMVSSEPPEPPEFDPDNPPRPWPWLGGRPGREHPDGWTERTADKDIPPYDPKLRRNVPPGYGTGDPPEPDGQPDTPPFPRRRMREPKHRRPELPDTPGGSGSMDNMEGWKAVALTIAERLLGPAAVMGRLGDPEGDPSIAANGLVVHQLISDFMGQLLGLIDRLGGNVMEMRYASDGAEDVGNQLAYVLQGVNETSRTEALAPIAIGNAKAGETMSTVSGHIGSLSDLLDACARTLEAIAGLSGLGEPTQEVGWQYLASRENVRALASGI